MCRELRMAGNEHVTAARPGVRPRAAAILTLALLGAVAGCAGAPEQADAEAATPAVVDARTEASEARAKGDLEAALRLFVEAAEQNPTDAEAFFEIGSIYDQRGDAALAARAYSRAVQIDPQHSRALEGLGLRYFADRQLDQAYPLLQRAAAADAELWRAHNALGLIADTRGEHEAAAAHFAAALAVRPGSATILNNRGYSSYLAGNFDAAERDFRAALSADPGYEKAWQNLGLLYARRGEYRMALATLGRVVEEYVAANDVGYIAMLSGDYTAAERLFAEAIRLSPRYYQAANENTAELRRRRTTTLTAQ
jgi:Flp pilus assembly protein TadD